MALETIEEINERLAAENSPAGIELQNMADLPEAQEGDPVRSYGYNTETKQGVTFPAGGGGGEGGKAFVVTYDGTDGDKTQLEIYAAMSAGKVCLLYDSDLTQFAYGGMVASGNTVYFYNTRSGSEGLTCTEYSVTSSNVWARRQISNPGEAPNDGVTYGRRNNSWYPSAMQISGESTSVHIMYYDSGNFCDMNEADDSFIMKPASFTAIDNRRIFLLCDGIIFCCYVDGGRLYVRNLSTNDYGYVNINSNERICSNKEGCIYYKGYIYVATTGGATNRLVRFSTADLSSEVLYSGTSQGVWGLFLCNGLIFFMVILDATSTYNAAYNPKNETFIELFSGVVARTHSIQFVNNKYYIVTINGVSIFDSNLSFLRKIEYTFDSAVKNFISDYLFSTNGNVYKINYITEEITDMEYNVGSGVHVVTKIGEMFYIQFYNNSNIVNSLYSFDAETSSMNLIKQFSTGNGLVIVANLYVRSYQAQADLQQTDQTQPDFIRNLPSALRSIPQSGTWYLKAVNGILQWSQS